MYAGVGAPVCLCKASEVGVSLACTRHKGMEPPRSIRASRERVGVSHCFEKFLWSTSYESTAGGSILRREWSVNKQTSCKIEFQVQQDKMLCREIDKMRGQRVPVALGCYLQVQ